MVGGQQGKAGQVLLNVTAQRPQQLRLRCTRHHKVCEALA